MTNVAWLKKALVMPRSRVVATVLAGIGLFLGAWSTVAAQGRLTVNPASKPSIVKQVSWIPPTSQPQFHIDFEGDKQKWWFVKITSYAAAADVQVDGAPQGYMKNEVLTKGVWYSFKEKLSVIIVIRDNKKAPTTAEFKFSLGYADGLPSESKPEDARSYGTRGDNISSVIGEYSIQLYWGEPAEIVATPSTLDLELSDKGSPKEVLFEVSSGDPLWKFVLFKPPTGMTLSLAPDNDPESMTVTPGLPIDSATWYGFKGKMKLKVSSDTREVGTVQNLEIDTRRQTTDVSNVEEAKAAIERRRLQADNQPKTVSVAIKKPKDSIDFLAENWLLMVVALMVGLVLLCLLIAKKGEQWIEAGRLRKQNRKGMNTGQQVTLRHTPQVLQGHKKPNKNATKKARDHSIPLESKAAEPRAAAQSTLNSRRVDNVAQVDSPKPATFQSPAIPIATSDATTTLDSQGVRQLIRKLIGEELTNQSLSINAEKRVDDMIVQTAKMLRDELAKSELDSERTVRELEKRIDTHQQSAVVDLTKEINALRTQLGSLDKAFDKKLEFDRTFDAKLESHQADPNPLYSKLLGHLFGIKVEGLQEGAFAEEVEKVSKALDEYLKTELPRAESLKDIKTKSDGIYQALCKLRDKAASLASGVDTELRKVVDAAHEIAADTDTLQSQLQNRTPALDVRLRIPVPAHEGARYTFIEELGFAIKGELDRIRDPESYYRRKLDRLVTGDIINIAELCDKQVAGGPGRNLQVEQALQALFTAAGLRSILPREGKGDAFDPAEQTLIQIIANKSGESQTVAEVVSRGFAYRDGQKEVLLRRAGVKIYR